LDYYLDDLERSRYVVDTDDRDVPMCPYCRVKLRCVDDECEIIQCPECGYEG
jgi:ribosomal protein L37AE/L43A